MSTSQCDVLDEAVVDGWVGCPPGLLVEPSEEFFELTVPVDIDSLEPEFAALPSALVTAALAGGPDSDTRSLLESLDVSQLPDFDIVDYLRAWQRQANAAHARLLDGVTLLADRCNGFTPSVAAEVACALRVTRPAADRLLHTARRLHASLPDTARAARDGKLSARHLDAIAQETASLDRDQCRQVEDTVLPKAAGQTAGEFRNQVRKAVAAIDPDGCEERHAKRRRDETDVQVQEYGDGLAFLTATAPVEDISVIKAAVDAWAGHHDRTRSDLSVGQRRVQALVEWASAYLTGDQAPRRHGRPVTVDVTVPLETLLGGNAPGEVIGYGPITAQAARRLAADSTLRRLITDPATGRLADCGTTRYVPDQKTRDFLLARERISGFPGSTVLADRCDLDHTVPHDHGGPTDPTNLGPLDRRAHRLKTLTGWRVTRDPVTGALEWTSPAGHTYRVETHDYRRGP